MEDQAPAQQELAPGLRFVLKSTQALPLNVSLFKVPIVINPAFLLDL